MTPASLAAASALFGLLGLGLGLVHFHGLHHGTRAYLAGGVGLRTVAFHLVRLLVTGAAFVVIARHGAVPLLAAFAGFVAARRIATARARESP